MNFLKKYYNFLLEKRTENYAKSKVDAYKETPARTLVSLLFWAAGLFVVYKISIEPLNFKSFREFLDYFLFNDLEKYEAKKRIYEVFLNRDVAIAGVFLAGLRYLVSKKFLVEKEREVYEKEVEQAVVEIEDNIEKNSIKPKKFIKMLVWTTIFFFLGVLLFWFLMELFL